MKQVVGIDCGNYTFSPSTNKITFIDLPELQLENIVLITDVTTGTVIFNFAVSGMTGTLTNSVLTLTYNVSGLTSTDRLMIIINSPSDSDNANIIKITHDTPGQQSKNIGIPVSLANEHILDLQTVMDSRTNPINNTVLGGVQDCLQYRTVAIQIDGGIGLTAGSLAFEGSNGIDTAFTNWVPVFLYDQAVPTTLPVSTFTLAASTNRFFSGPLHYRYFRVRVAANVTGGQVSLSSVYRMAPYVSAVTQISPAIGGVATVTAGVNGVQAIGGNIAAGLAPTTNPVTMGGVDVGGLVRRIVTDLQGQQVVVGPDQTKVISAQPLNVVIGNKRFGTDELLEMILQELKLMSFYLKELPWQLNIGQNFVETIDDFTRDNIDKSTNS